MNQFIKNNTNHSKEKQKLQESTENQQRI